MAEKALEQKNLVHQFIREAIITARLEHPHIIPVHELGFLVADQLYYTMTYVDGCNFADIEVTLPLFERLRILRAAAIAAQHAHIQGLWHRDIKPQNILVGKRGEVYLIDWGLVSVQPGRQYRLNIPQIVVQRYGSSLPDDLLLERTSAALTASDVAVGTARYMAPEQILGEPAGLLSDVWAFGVILFEMLTGQHPCGVTHEMSPLAAVGRIVRQSSDVPRVRDIKPDVPTVLDSICAQALMADVRKRMPSLDSFIETIADFLRRSGELTFRLGDQNGLAYAPTMASRPPGSLR